METSNIFFLYLKFQCDVETKRGFGTPSCIPNQNSIEHCKLKGI